MFVFLLSHAFALEPAPAGLVVHAELRPRTRFALTGEVEAAPRGFTVRRAGGAGRALLDELAGALQAAGWKVVDGMPAAEAVIGVSDNAVASRWQRGRDLLGLQLFDAGFGGETVATVSGPSDAPAVLTRLELGLPGGVRLPIEGTQATLRDGRLCAEVADGAAMEVTWSAALLGAGWNRGTGDWWVRGDHTLTVDEACLELDAALSPGWAALRLPLAGTRASTRGPDNVTVDLADVAAVEPWIRAAEASLVASGWMLVPASGADGRRLYAREGVRLSLRPDGDAPFVNLVVDRSASRGARSGPALALDLPGGGKLPLGRAFLRPGEPLTAWSHTSEAGEGAPLLDAARATLVGLGWEAEPGAPADAPTFAKAGHRISLQAASGFDTARAESVVEMHIRFQPPAAPPPATGRRRGQPDRGAPAPAAEPPPYRLSVELPGGTLPLEGEGVIADGDAVCLTTPDAVDRTRAAWAEALKAAGWASRGAWYEREGRRASIDAGATAEQPLCLRLDVSPTPFWSALALPLADTFVLIATDVELGTLLPDAAAADATFEAAARALTAAGWAAAAPERISESGTFSFRTRAYTRADQEITVTRALGPGANEVSYTRRGPALPW